MKEITTIEQFKDLQVGNELTMDNILQLMISDPTFAFKEEYGVMVRGRKFLVIILSDEKVVSLVMSAYKNQPIFKVIHRDR